MERHYDWNRYWLDRRASEGSNDGYLSTDEHGDWFERVANAWQLSELTGEPCLVLLGEAGLGKTESLRDAALLLQEQVDQEREVVHLFDLGADESPELLAARLKGRQWEEWLGQGKILHLFLDSFDEGVINQQALGKFLVRELEGASEALPRLRLRIACRSAEWPSGLSERLRRIMRPAYPGWPGSLPRELALAQLSENDVGLAAEAEGLNRWAFLRQIADRDLKGLAALPLTLKMLLDATRESGELPDGRTELFEQTTRRLLAEYDDLRPQPSSGGLQPGQHMAVAERIAAATLLSAHSTIAKRSGTLGAAHLDPAELSGFSEEDSSAAGGAAFLVEVDQIVEVLQTPLFVDAGRDAVRFRHRSLAEFLAASYLTRHRLDEDRVLSLFTPWLREVAVWTAALQPELLPKLLELDPEMLPRIGRLHLSAEQSEALVRVLLTERIGGAVDPWEYRLWPSLRSLAHPGLAETLREPLGDKEAPGPVRAIAIAIAGACELKESEADLLALALDPREEPDLRALAAYSLGRFAAPETRRALVPLALEPIPDDENDAIKGAALRATFPRSIDAATVFASLTPPRNPVRFGGYSLFLSHELPDAMTAADLPAALRWAAEVAASDIASQGPRDELDLLVDQILRRAWSHLDDPEIVAGVAAVVRRRLRACSQAGLPGGPGEDAFDEAEGRHVLLECLIDEIGDDPAVAERIDPAQLLASSPSLLRYSDLGWVLEMFEDAVGSEREARWAALLARVYDLREPWLERIFDLMQRSEELCARLEHLLGPVALDSAPDDAPYMDQVVSEALDRLERDEPEAWLELDDALMRGPRGEDGGCDPLEADITCLPGWKRADHVARRRIVAAARHYLEQADPRADEWFGQQELPSRAAASYRALYLLAEGSWPAPELDRNAWARWTPVILDYPVDARAGRSAGGSHHVLLRVASEQAPDAFARWAARRVDCDAARGDGHLPLLRRFWNIRPASLTAALLPKLAGESIQGRSLAELLKWTLECDWVRSIEIVGPGLAEAAASRDAEARETATLAAATIFKARPAAGWPLLKRLLKRDRQLGSAILLQAAVGEVGGGGRIDLEALPDAQLSELHDALVDLFPPDPDPGAEPDDGPPPPAPIRSLRAGTQAELAYREDHREQGVTTPKEIIQACCANDPLLISSDEDLQRAVLASLDRIQHSLQRGQPRTVPELWERSPRRPKTELEVSDWLSNRLYEDLRAGGRDVNREVLSEPSKSGKGRGESIDIQITAPKGKLVQGSEVATVIVEIKGSWNSGLKTEMESQLVDKYLRRSRTSHGIYVVLRFASDDWDSKDWRRAPSARMTLEETRELLEKQAAELSRSGELSVRAVVLDCSL